MSRRHRTPEEAVRHAEIEFRLHATSAIHRLGKLVLPAVLALFMGSVTTRLMMTLPELFPGPAPIRQTPLVSHPVEPVDSRLFDPRPRPGRAEALEARRIELEKKLLRSSEKN